MKKFTRVMLFLFLLASLVLLPEMFRTTRDFFSPIFRTANSGHFMLHPATLLLSLGLLALPIVLLLAILGWRCASIAAAVISLYVPIYLAFGAYVVTPQGLLPTPWLWVLVIVLVACMNLFLYLNHRQHGDGSNKSIDGIGE